MWHAAFMQTLEIAWLRPVNETGKDVEAIAI